MINEIIKLGLPYFLLFIGAFIFTLIFTPIVRELNRKWGLVDKPDPRRINKVPIPRGGGIALVLGVHLAYLILVLFAKDSFLQSHNLGSTQYWKLLTLSLSIAALGYVDDKFSLSAKLKLVGQLIIAFLAWWWAGLGFVKIFPCLPFWIDCLLTMFWFVGAINAFNLIDGLDGLASGIAFIASLGMAGALFVSGNNQTCFFHFAFAGGLLGFLRYNYNPASVFLGDSGSMFIGFSLAALPLVSQIPDSFVVSVGVPLLAMGVPIFDSSLAIIRRTIRKIIMKKGMDPNGNNHVMTADSDHLHHRLLRSFNLNQRKAAWALYCVTFLAVIIGLITTSMHSRISGLWLLVVTLASIVIFRNMGNIEIYDAARLISSFARNKEKESRRKIARLKVPVFLGCDFTIIIASCTLIYNFQYVDFTVKLLTVDFLIRSVPMLLMLICFKTYQIIWSRAMLSNFMRLLIATILGGVLGSFGVSIFAHIDIPFISLLIVSINYIVLSFFGFFLVRIIRSIVRDAFYALDCSRLRGRKDIKRVLVYGCGLRYRTFRRELVRTTSANKRIIVGILDDDIILRGQYIGLQRVEGMLIDAPEVINRLNVDEVVIACVVTPEWMKVIKDTLIPTGVKITQFSFSETQIL